MAFMGSKTLGHVRKSGQLMLAWQMLISRPLSTSVPLTKFWERDIRAEYKKDRKVLPDKKQIIDGFEELRNEVKMWKDEVWDTFTKEPLYLVRPGKPNALFSMFMCAKSFFLQIKAMVNLRIHSSSS